MLQQLRSVVRIDSPHFPTPRQWKALHLLCEAWILARWAGQDVWQFAVEIDQLRALGLSHTDLRCLLCRGYLEHARERSTASTSVRIFQPLRTLILPPRTCFVLTARGWKAASELGTEKSANGVARAEGSMAVPCSLPKTPRWDGEARQLWWEGYLLKEFRRPAVNQQLVLTALEEEGWPPRIDDPLPPTAGINPKVRLHDTIKTLNRHHLYRHIRFGGDGRGRGIHWFFLERDGSDFP